MLSSQGQRYLDPDSRTLVESCLRKAALAGLVHQLFNPVQRKLQGTLEVTAYLQLPNKLDHQVPSSESMENYNLHTRY
jgi:hypothetical protein